jgi:uncharacterized metal-binding protein YceD (DUF177 family)
LTRRLIAHSLRAPGRGADPARCTAKFSDPDKKFSMIEPEFSRRVELVDIPRDGVRQRIEASGAERERLAERFGVQSIPALSALVEAKPLQAGTYLVSIDFDAEVVQLCVTSLEPVSSRLQERITVSCRAIEADSGADVFVEPDGEEPPEPIVDGGVDVGELLAQYLALAIDPYPRRTDVSLSGAMAGGELSGADVVLGEPTRENPFAVLSGMVRRD